MTKDCLLNIRKGSWGDYIGFVLLFLLVNSVSTSNKARMPLVDLLGYSMSMNSLVGPRLYVFGKNGWISLLRILDKIYAGVGI